jgi:hypothetical protein
MNPTTRAAIAVVLFVAIFISGIGLSRLGRPLNVRVSTLHKLISLGTGVLILVTIFQRAKVTPLNPAEWIAVVVTGLCFVATVASGGVLSGDKPMPVALLRVHQVAPVLATIGSAVTLYLVLGR